MAGVGIVVGSIVTVAAVPMLIRRRVHLIAMNVCQAAALLMLATLSLVLSLAAPPFSDVQRLVLYVAVVAYGVCVALVPPLMLTVAVDALPQYPSIIPNTLCSMGANGLSLVFVLVSARILQGGKTQGSAAWSMDILLLCTTIGSVTLVTGHYTRPRR